MAAAAARFGARFERRPAVVAPGPEPRGPGPRRPASPSCRPGWPRATRWTTRPRPSWSTCSAAPARTAWPAWRPDPDTRCSTCAGARPTPCARPPGSCPCATPATTTPPSCATGCATSCCRCAPRSPGRDPVPLLARQAGVLRDEVGAHRRAGPRRAARPGRRAGGGAHQPPARPPALRRWLRGAGAGDAADDAGGDGHPPSLAEVDRVLEVAAGAAVGTELSGGRRRAPHGRAAPGGAEPLQ